MITVLPVGAEASPGPSTAIPDSNEKKHSKLKQVKIHGHGAGTSQELDTAMVSIV